jgi:hypothetical protein
LRDLLPAERGGVYGRAVAVAGGDVVYDRAFVGVGPGAGGVVVSVLYLSD